MVGLVPDDEAVDARQRPGGRGGRAGACAARRRGRRGSGGSGGSGSGTGNGTSGWMNSRDEAGVLGRRGRRRAGGVGRRRERAGVAQRDGGGEVGVGLRVDVRARPRAGRVVGRPVRRPEADVDERLQAGGADRADRGVQAGPARLLVGAGVGGVEALGLGLLLGRARQRRPARGDAHAVDAELLHPRDGGLDLGRRAVEQQAVVLEDRLQARLESGGASAWRRGLDRRRRGLRRGAQRGGREPAAARASAIRAAIGAGRRHAGAV